MGQEIERKFLVNREKWQAPDEGCYFRQGYLSTHPHCIIRIRITGDQAYLTLKGKSKGLVRPEFEYSIPLSDAQQILEELHQGPLIEKVRYRLTHHNLVWEVDEFLGDNTGLILAEVELSDPLQPVDLPQWIDQEVTDDARYYNSNLINHPYRQWN